jgi:hypothetical protein
VDRLREFFSRRGIAIGASGLVVVISANAVHAAPVTLATTISTAAVLAGTAAHASTAIAATKAIAMTALQKATIAATVAVLAGIGVYEARQNSQLHEQNKVLQQQQSPLAQQVRQLQASLSEANGKLADLSAETARSTSNSPEAELLKLRAEVTRLRRDSQELAQLKGAETNDPAQVELKSWLAAVKKLKEEAQNNPKARIPEFSLLTEQDWLNAAKYYGKRPQFDAATDLRVAMAELRQTAQNAFATYAQQALERYAKDHDGAFPTDLSQFQPYLPTAIDGQPVDGTILQRYEIAPAAKFGRKEAGQEWVLTQKELVDDEYDHHIAIGPRDWSYTASEAEQLPPDVRALKRILDPVAKEYSAANNGEQPTDPSQLLPYLKTDEQKVALQKMTEMRNASQAPNK